MKLSFQSYSGELPDDALEAVARLRIAVFRSWPYLYDGDMDYERSYLSKLAAGRGALIVVARDGLQVAGAATGMPLAEEHDAFKAPFLARDIDTDKVFYCAESVLLPEYRGLGAGHAFFDMREAHARSLGARQSAFCGVVRKPGDRRATGETAFLEAFWRKRGYDKIDGLRCSYSWRDIGDAEPSDKTMQFWMKDL